MQTNQRAGGQSAGHRRSRIVGGRAAGMSFSLAMVGALLFSGIMVHPTSASAVPSDETTVSEPAEVVVDPSAADAGAPADDSEVVTESPVEDPAELPTEESAGAESAEAGAEVVPSQAKAKAANAEITPFVVPNPPAGSAIISVKVGGDRLANGTVQGLAGVQLGLYTGTASADPGGASVPPIQGALSTRHSAAWGWTTCTSDADGDCNFTIPIRAGAISATGVPQDTRFWVVQETSPLGWYSNPTMRVGGFGATPEGLWQYRFRTDIQLRANTIYRSTDAMPWGDPAVTGAGNPDRYFMRNRPATNTEGSMAANVTRTTGVWSQSRNNPVFPADCGLDIALIADTSGSLGATGIADMKSSMSSFVDAFRGTATRMSLFSFSNISPGSGATNHPNLLPVTTATQGATFKAQYADWLSGGGTNWDRGFAEAANASAKYDLAILLTDGNPTVIRDNSTGGASAFNALQDIDAGIASANQLKSQGTRVVALGVGPAMTANSEYNLRAVSGPTSGSDYYRAASFAEATQALVALASANCDSSLGVQKMIVPTGGTIADATPAPAGWQFNASTTATGVTVKAPASQTTVAGGDGKVEFGLGFTASTPSGDVQVLETQQAGYEVVPVGAGAAARNAVCTNVETGATVAVTNAGTTAQPGFTVQALKDQRVECKIYNRALAPGKLELAKSSDPASGTSLTPGQNVTYTLTFRNTGELPVTVNHDDVLDDVLDDATLQGAITAQTPLAAVLNGTGNRLRITGTLQPGTTRTVTYTMKVKDPLPTTTNAVMRNYVVPTGELPPTSCVPGQPCTEHPVKVTLSWNKVNLEGDLLSGSEWLLTPINSKGIVLTGEAITVIDCVAASAAACTGADRDPAAGKFLIPGLKPMTYRLTETKAPAGYQLITTPIDIVVQTNVSFGDIENEQIEVPEIPLTGGLGTLGFTLAAGGFGIATAAAVWWQRRRRTI